MPATINAAQNVVVVKAPIDQVYEQWARVEDLPKFITPLLPTAQHCELDVHVMP